MLAAVFDGQGGIRLEERADPVPPPGEALVRVLLAGLCSTDRELRRGYMGFRGVAGHEFVGEVLAAPARPELVGQRVVGEINAACGQCDLCAEGLPRHCRHRTVLGILGRDGAFATHLCLPVANLHPLPAELPTERALFAEPLAAAFAILEQVAVCGREAVVLGPGKLGRLIAEVLVLAGAEVTVLGRRAASLAGLAARGVRTAVLGSEEAPPPGTAEIVVEATGHPDGLAQALRLVRPRGTVVLKTTCAGAHTVELAPVVVDEVTVVGSRCGPFEPALQALAAGELTPERAIAARLPLERIEEAFALAFPPPAQARGPAGQKVVLEIGT
ncbi:MAG: alcohol dehydrogenase [Planctomycetota bacterium]|nr:MAG: alcohol dehydrogenase [Planctomycetota bacterium]